MMAHVTITETYVWILTFPFASHQFPSESISFIIIWMLFERWAVIIGHGFECLIEIHKAAIFSRSFSSIAPIDFDTIQGDVYLDQLIWW